MEVIYSSLNLKIYNEFSHCSGDTTQMGPALYAAPVQQISARITNQDSVKIPAIWILAHQLVLNKKSVPPQIDILAVSDVQQAYISEATDVCSNTIMPTFDGTRLIAPSFTIMDHNGGREASYWLTGRESEAFPSNRQGAEGILQQLHNAGLLTLSAYTLGIKTLQCITPEFMGKTAKLQKDTLCQAGLT